MAVDCAVDMTFSFVAQRAVLSQRLMPLMAAGAIDMLSSVPL
jgi:hypothetical protein